MSTSNHIIKLLEPFRQAKKAIVPAYEHSLATFYRRTAEYGVPDSAVEQLVEFYQISNGTPCLDGFCLHPCDDEILFEWWESECSLWLGLQNDDIFRWSNDKFCLGDASNLSYGEEHEFSTLTALLQFIFNEWESNAQ